MGSELIVISRQPSARSCEAPRPDGSACRMAPLRDSAYCFAHDPDHREEATKARHAGSLRRRREAVVAIAYDLDGLPTLDVARRLLQIAASDTLGLENSIARSRTLTNIAAVALR